MARRTHFGIFAIAVAVVLATAAASIFCAAPTAAAETNAEIKIAPDETSLYAAYDGHVAYTTKDGVLHLSTLSGSYSHPEAFVGTALSVAMTSNRIFLLSDMNGTKTISAFDYVTNGIGAKEDAFDALGISQEQYSNLLPFSDTLTVTDEDLIVTMGNFRTGAHFVRLSLSDNSSSFRISNVSSSIDNVAAFDSKEFWYISTKNLFYFSGELYSDPVQIAADRTWLSVAALGGKIYAAAADGVYRVDGTAVVKISDVVADGDIRPYSEGRTSYLLVQNRAENSVVQYSIDGDGLKYYSVFDNVVYVAPSEYPIMTVGKASAATQGYFSPKNLKPVASLGEGDNVLVLAEVPAEDGSAEGYYYIRTSADADGEMCYVRKSALTLLERGEGWKHGTYAASTHGGLRVLQYPFDGAAVVATVGPKDALVVSGDIGRSAEGWNWVKVSLMTADGTVVDGYTTEEDLGPYGPYELPSFGVDAIVNADKLGETVNVYSLPEERDELVIDTLTDGEVVRLAAEGLNVDEEWTLIGYETEDGTAMSGYVKTAYLSEGGLTTLQITLIVVACIVAVLTVVIVIIIAKKRKRERYE